MWLKKLAAEYKDLHRTPEWLSSHPETLQRIKNAEAYVAKHPCKTCVPLSWNKTEILAELNAGLDKNLTQKISRNEYVAIINDWFCSL